MIVYLPGVLRTGNASEIFWGHTTAPGSPLEGNCTIHAVYRSAQSTCDVWSLKEADLPNDFE
jgi:hypothetical protein